MTDIGAVLGNLLLILGIMVGLAGIVMVAAAYPTYYRVLKKKRKESHQRFFG